MRWLNEIFGLKDVFEFRPINLPEWTDEEERKAQQKLEEKRQQAISYLGEKWIMHPKHKTQKLDIGLNSLGRAS